MTVFEKENVFLYIFSSQSVSVEIKNYLAPRAPAALERNLFKYAESENVIAGRDSVWGPVTGNAGLLPSLST